MRPEQEKGPMRPKFQQKLLQPTASVVLSIAAFAPTLKDSMFAGTGFEHVQRVNKAATQIEHAPGQELKLKDMQNKVFVVQIASDKQTQNILNIPEIAADSVPEEPGQNVPVIAQAVPEQTDPEDAVWYELENCESTHNPKAVDPSETYFGLYQFDDQTWQSEGGTGHASDASPSEQLMRAKSLKSKRGWNPWPSCARKLGLLK